MFSIVSLSIYSVILKCWLAQGCQWGFLNVQWTSHPISSEYYIFFWESCITEYNSALCRTVKLTQKSCRGAWHKPVSLAATIVSLPSEPYHPHELVDSAQQCFLLQDSLISSVSRNWKVLSTKRNFNWGTDWTHVWCVALDHFPSPEESPVKWCPSMQMHFRVVCSLKAIRASLKNRC